MRTAVLLFVCLSAHAQVFTFTRDQLMKYTAKNPYDRFENGRPKVPDSVLEKVRGLTQEEVWTVLPGKGFPNQYEGNWQVLHPEKTLVGRAVTAQYMPLRPDVHEVVEADAKSRGLATGVNQRVIDMLQPGDVLVVDLFGKTESGTFVGDNLATAVFSATKAGMVIDGSIRDLNGIFPIPMGAYFRGVHPSALRNVTLTAVNTPVRIGNATVLPGDVVLGDREGVSFIPPHLVQEILDKAEETHIHDEWTKKKFETGQYKSSDLYPRPRDPKLKEEYEAYKKSKLKK